ncbi:hypothetical protein [Nocardia noduli]|uniref:hypothetical protein n=1 Tax=Nocardia noduli TaxID=2815722 RepID=UPI001C21F9F7|nr:hypothetical protein [Nocardia noduli]
MASSVEVTREFERLAGEASSGQLIIEFDAAERCAKWCDDYCAELRILMTRARDLVYVDSFGDLNSASTLGVKFQTLARGGQGSGSYSDALSDHIKILEAMADMYRKAGAAYKACDEQTQQAIKQQTNKVA